MADSVMLINAKLMKKILWLASWYPNKLDPFLGDFIQRHAQAVSLFRMVYVIYVIKDEKGKLTTDVRIETHESGNLIEVIAYYKPKTIGISGVDRLLSLVKYLKLYKRLIASFIKAHGTPSLVHVHVAMWAGVLARWIKGKWKVKYLVTEHWSGYNKISFDNFYNKDLIFRKNAVAVLKGASLLLPVSAQLAQQITGNVLQVKYQVVSNVVDTRYFTYAEAASLQNFRFLHVSTMDRNKNADIILRIFSKLLTEKPGCELVLVGPLRKDLQLHCDNLGLNNVVHWRGEMPYFQVASEMQQASAMVMFSRYENQPCVILEAQCCGLPVIATAVGGVPEIVNPENGILVEPGNESSLLEAMHRLVDSPGKFNKGEISRKATRLYNYQTIGEQISRLYDTLLEEKPL